MVIGGLKASSRALVGLGFQDELQRGLRYGATKNDDIAVDLAHKSPAPAWV